MADEQGSFDWAAPSEDVHALVNDLQRPVGTMLLGRRMYEVLVAWETWDTSDEPAAIRDYAGITASGGQGRVLLDARRGLERADDGRASLRPRRRPRAEGVRRSGPRDRRTAARRARDRAGLVDEYQLFVVPTVVGGGTRFFPDGVRLDLDLVDQRRFGNGTVHLRYRARS